MAEQMNLPFFLDEAKLQEFLTRYVAIEDEFDRLREEQRLLKKQYNDDVPMRGLLAAVKIVRTTRKLETHPKEPLARVHLAYLARLVEEHLEALEAETRAVPDMTREG